MDFTTTPLAVSYTVYSGFKVFNCVSTNSRSVLAPRASFLLRLWRLSNTSRSVTRFTA